MFKLNDNKTEFIIFGMRQQLSKMSNIKRNLGFIMYLLLKNYHHIGKLTSTLSYQLRNVYQICARLDVEPAKMVVQALCQQWGIIPLPPGTMGHYQPLVLGLVSLVLAWVMQAGGYLSTQITQSGATSNF